MATKSNIISIVEASHPEEYGQLDQLHWKDCWAEAGKFSEVQYWAKRAAFEGWAWVIARTSARNTEPGVASLVGSRRLFTLFVKTLNKEKKN